MRSMTDGAALAIAARGAHPSVSPAFACGFGETIHLPLAGEDEKLR